MDDPAAASRHLVDHALSRFSTDNLSCMIVRLDREAHLEAQSRAAGTGAGAEGEKGEEGEGGFRPTALDSTVEEEPGAGEERRGENGLDTEGGK